MDMLKNIIISLITGIVSSVLVSKSFLIYEELKNLYDSLINKKLVRIIQSNYMAIEQPELIRALHKNPNYSDEQIRNFYYNKMSEDIKQLTWETPIINKDKLDDDLKEIYYKYNNGINELKAAVLGKYDIKIVKDQIDMIVEVDRILQENRNDFFKTKCLVS